MEVAAAGFVYKGNGAVVANAFDVAIGPDLSGEGFVCGFGVGINLVRRAVNDVNVAAIGLPTGCGGGSKALVGKGYTSIVFFLEFVRCRAWHRIAAFPKLLDEMIAFFSGGELNKGGAFRVIGDVNHVVVKPFVV